MWSIRMARLIPILWGLLFPAVGATHESGYDLLSALKLEKAVLLCGETVPVDDPQVMERFEKEMLVSLGNRPQVILWLKRTTRYFPAIEKILGENGLPDDIKYLAIAESALRVHAGSRKGAMGMWQLMPQTAKKYGLLVNGNVDERRNPFLSTAAAVSYLKDLHDRFGSWSLCLAAYNMGEEGLEAEILEQGINDFYRLYLPLETQRFILRILAIKRIVQAPQKYGFHLSEEDFYIPKTFSTVQINAFADLPLSLIARAAKTDFKIIKDLNPELRGYYLTVGTRMLNIPGNAEKGFHNRLAGLIETDANIRAQHIYMVKKGDNLTDVAGKFNVPLAALLIWNRIGKDRVIHPGQRLVILPAARRDKTVLQDNQGEANR